MKTLTLIWVVLSSFFMLDAGISGQVRIKGKFVDPFGNPVVKTSCEVAIGNNEEKILLNSNKDGDYAATITVKDQRSVFFACRGYLKTSIELPPSLQSDVVINIGLIAGYLGDAIPSVVTGNVMLIDKPLSGVSIDIINPFCPRLNISATSDTKGKFRVNLNYPGQYVLHVYSPNCTIQSEVITVESSLPRLTYTKNFSLSLLR